MPKKSGLARRLGVFGDFPSRAARGAMRLAPWFLEPFLIGGWALLFFALARSQRHAVAFNLRALHPGWNSPRILWGTWRVFWNFALTFVDGLRCESGTGGVDWVVEGQEYFDELSGRKEGCIILTAHMGNYDVAAPMFSSRFGKPLYAVRAPEREPELQRIREREIREKESRHPFFRTLYNREGSLLGVELAGILEKGHLVAVQGDRVVFDVSPMDIRIGDLHIRMPKGPLFLARLTRAPCYPLFITRDGWRRYRIKLLPCLELPPRRRGEDLQAAELWAGTILREIRLHWSQWFVFEKTLWRTGDSP